MWHKAVLPHLTSGFNIVIALVHAEILLVPRRWYGTESQDVIQSIRDQHHVIDVGTVHCQGQWDSVCVAQEASLGSFFSPDPSGLDRCLLLRAVL